MYTVNLVGGSWHGKAYCLTDYHTADDLPDHITLQVDQPVVPPNASIQEIDSCMKGDYGELPITIKREHYLKCDITFRDGMRNVPVVFYYHDKIGKPWHAIQYLLNRCGLMEFNVKQFIKRPDRG